MNTRLELAKNLQSAYDELYTDDMTEWRELGGKYKAENILKVCEGRTFRKVLDCGAGEGSILKHLDAEGSFEELHAIEISDSGVSQIRKRKLRTLVEVKKFDGYTVPYPDGHFDMSYCSHVVEHVEHPRILLRELARVSKFQVLEIPLDYSIGVDDRMKDFLSYGHINIFTPSLFKFLVKSEGFEILREHYAITADEVVRHRWYKRLGYRRTPWRELKIALRPLRNILRRIVWGRRRYYEYSFSTYTCLTAPRGALNVF
jgi:ubiquinone/menaquinone biosynthesis C-methylase UbiE